MIDAEAISAAETETPQARGFELDRPDEYSQYLLHSRTEILFILRSLVQRGAMMTVYFDHGQSFLLTSVVAVNAEANTLVFDYGSNEEMNRKALFADRFIFTTTLDKVKIQFGLNRLERTEAEGRPAFRGAIPETLLRLQRREYYRLATPIANPIRCIIPLRADDGSARRIVAPLLDISGGGVGLMIPPEQRDTLPVDAQFNDCQIELPDEGVVSATLRVRSVFDVATKSGNRYLRAGLEFVNLPGTRLTLIQRYITRIERERKARLSGMV